MGGRIKLTEMDPDRFWAKVAKSAGCWEWMAFREKNGYGVVYKGRKAYFAHRVAYALHNGEDPGELFVCHSCDNPACCNPEHLWLGTTDDNMADMVAKGRSNGGRPENFRGKDGKGILVPARGEGHPKAILTEAEVLEILTSPLSARAAAEKFGVSLKNIYNVRQRLSWKHISVGEDA